MTIEPPPPLTLPELSLDHVSRFAAAAGLTITQAGPDRVTGWIEDMRGRHQEMLATPWSETASIALYEMNAQFHEGLVAGSRNRYWLVAIQQQNRLRRFTNYDWTFGHARVVVSCREHLDILDSLEAGDQAAAAELMRRHLDGAAKLSPVFAGGAAKRKS